MKSLFRAWLMGALCVAHALAGCAIDSVPLPEDNFRNSIDDGSGAPPEPALEAIALIGIYYTFTNPSTVLIAGTTGSVPSGSTVLVINDSAGPATVVAFARDDGSFAVPAVFAAAGDTPRIRVERNGTLIDEVNLPLRTPPADLGTGLTGTFFVDGGLAFPGAAADVDSAGAPIVIVTGDPGTLPPGLRVIVVNLDQGAAGESDVAPDGGFAVAVEGVSGDSLILFAVNPAVSASGGPTSTLAVP